MKNLKRVLSLMMAVLLCFGLFPGSALAAENDYDGYLAMIEYKDRRYSLSENLPAPFGGRTTEEFFELRINDLRTYRTAYCIQMGVRANSGIGYEASDDYASFTEEQKALINTTLTLGYNMETGTKYGGSAIDEYIATQILIWLIAHNQLGTGYESQIVDEITANSPAAKPIFYTLRENVMNYRTIPSFTTDDPSAVGAYTHALQYNESTGKNETTLVDENNVLGDFTFSCPGVDFSVDGNQLHVSTSETDFGTITAEKSLPSSIPGVITGGTKYWLRDTYQNVVTFDVEGEAQPVKCYFSLEIRSGTLQIVKTSEDGEVSGIPFHISGNGVERDVVTGPDGTIGVDNLQAGTYTITEQSPDRYVQPASQQVTIYPGQTASVSFSNVLKKFTVTMEKVDSVTGEAQGDASLDGAVYGMFKGETLLDTYTTSGGGKFITKEYPCGPDYSIREVSPSEGYLLDETVYPVGAEPGNFTLEHNSVPMTATEDVVLGSIAITKHTDQPAIPEQDAPAPETEPPTEEEAAVTEEQQTESAEEAPASSTPENGAVPENSFEPSSQPEENEAADEGQAGEGSTAPENDAVQEPADVDQPDAADAEAEAVPLAVTSNEVQIEQPEAGAEFQVYLASAGSYENAKESERDILLTDSYGFAQSKDLPYGLYVVHQTAGAEGQKFVPDFSVFISEHGKTYYFILNNPTFTSLIRFEKRDAESGEIIPLAGTSVKIRNADTGEWVVQHINYPSPMDIDTFVTDSTGTLMLPEALGFGNYELYEQQSPWGYVLDDEPVPFVVDGTQDVVTVTKYNTVQKGTITVHKEGEVFSHVTEAGGLYQPQYEVQGQPGAVYDITALEDIVTPDGVVHAKAGELVAALTTGSDGTATSEPLYLGRYQVSERTAPAGMVLDPEPKEVTLAYAGQEVSVTTADVGFVNERQKVEINLQKLLEQDETFSIGMNEEWKNITFGLFAAEEIVAADGSSIPADGLIETTGIDENGNAAFKTDLPCGASLYVKEIGTDEHYLLSDEKYPVVFEYAGQDVATVQLKVNDGEAIENTLKYGDYFLHEKEAPAFFQHDEGYYPFSITENGAIVRVETEAGVGFLNHAQTGSLKVVKTADDDKIEGRTFKITGTDFMGNAYEQEFQTDENGEINVNLRVGEYTVSEVAGEDSKQYILPDDQPVEILAGETVTVAMHNKLVPEVPTVPQTGDNPWMPAVLIGLSALALLAGGGLLAMHLVGKKKRSAGGHDRDQDIR